MVRKMSPRMRRTLSAVNLLLVFLVAGCDISSNDPPAAEDAHVIKKGELSNSNAYDYCQSSLSKGEMQIEDCYKILAELEFSEPDRIELFFRLTTTVCGNSTEVQKFALDERSCWESFESAMKMCIVDDEAKKMDGLEFNEYSALLQSCLNDHYEVLKKAAQ
jgi:hypothetical protein